MCAETQYWQLFCCANASAMRSRVPASRLPLLATPNRPRNARKAAGELAQTFRKFGTMPS